MVDIRLTSDIDCTLSWDITDPDEGISIQQDIGELQPEYVFTTGTGVGRHDESWYRDLTIPANGNITVDLQLLSTKYLGINLTKSVTNVKVLTVENTSPSSTILIGSSGVSNSLDFIPILFEIGYSGLYETTSLVGYNVTSTTKNLKLTNTKGFDIICKVLILGE